MSKEGKIAGRKGRQAARRHSKAIREQQWKNTMNAPFPARTAIALRVLTRESLGYLVIVMAYSAFLHWTAWKVLMQASRGRMTSPPTLMAASAFVLCLTSSRTMRRAIKSRIRKQERESK